MFIDLSNHFDNVLIWNYRNSWYTIGFIQWPKYVNGIYIFRLKCVHFDCIISHWINSSRQPRSLWSSLHFTRRLHWYFNSHFDLDWNSSDFILIIIRICVEHQFHISKRELSHLAVIRQTFHLSCHVFAILTSFTNVYTTFICQIREGYWITFSYSLAMHTKNVLDVNPLARAGY